MRCFHYMASINLKSLINAQFPSNGCDKRKHVNYWLRGMSIDFIAKIKLIPVLTFTLNITNTRTNFLAVLR